MARATECCYAECRLCLLPLVLNVINKPYMLSAIMLSLIMLSVIMLSVIMLSVIMLSVIMLSVIMLNVIMLMRRRRRP